MSNWPFPAPDFQHPRPTPAPINPANHEEAPFAKAQGEQA